MTLFLRSLMTAFLLLAALVQGAVARAVVDESHCHVSGFPPSLRQTIIIIDGQLIEPEPAGPKAENQVWRRFIMQFLNNADPLVRQRIDARERVTVVVANADGSGVTPFFIGCVPLYRIEEESSLDASTTNLELFFGNDWRSQLKKAGERFVNGATLALVQSVSLLPEGIESGKAFRESSLISALARTPLVSLESGLPRIILYTDLDNYEFPSGEPAAIRATARADADRVGVNLSYAEVHVFGSGRNQPEHVRHYLSSFLLSSRGHLATLTSRDGAMAAAQTPRSVSRYQGTVDFPETLHPLRLRMALDQNGTLVNSWVEMQASLPKFVPVFGVLTCPQQDKCIFVGDNIFAQIWDDDPDPRPDLKPWQPFGGMRNLHFELDGDRISGRIRDELGFIAGREEGLGFTLDKIEGALF